MLLVNQVDVYSPVEHFELNCPPAVEANQEFCCPVSVYQGSNMYLEAKFTGGSEMSTPLDGKMICLTVAPFSNLTQGRRYLSDSFPLTSHVTGSRRNKLSELRPGDYEIFDYMSQTAA